MGNVHPGSTLTRTTGALDSFVAELGTDIVYEKRCSGNVTCSCPTLTTFESIGSARFLKTVKCRHRNGYLVIKVFIKPDPGLSLRTYLRRLKSESISFLFVSRNNNCLYSGQGIFGRYSKYLQLPGVCGDGQSRIYH
jgi:phosphoinositide-3-kinase, regulatory subunit 4